MVEWFRANETKGSGAYSRQVPNQSARRCYNGLMNAASLLWKMCIRDSTHGAGVAQDLKTFASYNAGPHELVCGMYPQILLDEAGRVAYTSFLEVLLEGDGGAYLWHCTEGKDRAGLGAVIVERALGVPEAYVRADYLATNLFVRNRAEGIVDAISKKLGLMKGLDADIDSLFYAYNDYYDCAMAAVNANYGSFDAYLAEALDFGPEKRQALRAKYLR